MKNVSPSSHTDGKRRPMNPVLDFLLRVAAVTGIFTAAILIFIFLLGQIIMLTPLSYEKKVGDAIFGDNHTSSAEAVYLQTLADKITETMGITNKMVVHYSEKDIVNAYSSLGGHIVVFKGVYEAADGNEEALAMLLAHEIAHVKHRDIAKSLLSILGDLLFVSTPSSSITEFTDRLGESNYSRRMENMADKAALDAVYKMYGSIDNALVLMDILADAAEDDDEPEILSSHPNKGKRIEALRKHAEKYQ